MSKENLKLWDSVCSTDPSATKSYKGVGGFSGTTINSIYLIRKATELFGPIGIGWGYEIISETITEGAPIAVPVEGSGPVLSDHKEKIHTLRLKLWYKHNGERGETEHFGHTQMVYVNKYGIQTEQEPSKKSLTDAMKKCLSMIGFSADIFLGEFDNAEYRDQVQTEYDIKKAENREEEIAIKQGELTEYVTRHLAVIKTAVSVNEIAGISKSAIRHLDRQGMIAELKQISNRGIIAITDQAEAKKKEIKNETL